MLKTAVIPYRISQPILNAAKKIFLYQYFSIFVIKIKFLFHFML
jgi:hypothetical protein